MSRRLLPDVQMHRQILSDVAASDDPAALARQYRYECDRLEQSYPDDEPWIGRDLKRHRALARGVVLARIKHRHPDNWEEIVRADDRETAKWRRWAVESRGCFRTAERSPMGDCINSHYSVDRPVTEIIRLNDRNLPRR